MEQVVKKARVNESGSAAKWSRSSKKSQDRPYRDDRDQKQAVVKDSMAFRQYYLHQNIVSSPEEFDALLATFQTPLPTTFRVSDISSFKSQILRRMHRYSNFEEVLTDGSVSHVTGPAPLAWYPGQLAFSFTTPRHELRKSPVLNEFHKFLVRETELGRVFRQEAVSMIPPLLLDVQPHHCVLDMCAAPGSKTAQLLEALHANDANAPPTGVVVANDLDTKRAYLLVHQTRRIKSPALMVTTQRAEHFPFLSFSSGSSQPDQPFRFDRVLCDVPCSGDGTLRKCVELWRQWHPNMAWGLHRLQLPILIRGLHLLKPGGLLVYSTCALNPLENEAVVAAALNHFAGSVELVETADMLPGFIRRPGMTSWQVQDLGKESVWYTNFDEVPLKRRKKLKSTCFPPAAGSAVGESLRRCMRIYPHLQNTGGFFVALLRKTSEAPITESPLSQVLGSSGPSKMSVDGDVPVAQTGRQQEQHEEEGEGEEQGPQEEQQLQQAEEEEEAEEEAEDTETILAEVRFKMAQDEEDVPTAEAEPLQAAPATEGKKRLKREDIFPEKKVKGTAVVPLLQVNPSLWESIHSFYGLSSNANFNPSQLFIRADQIKKVLYLSQSAARLFEANGRHKLRLVSAGTDIFAKSNSRDMQCKYRVCQEGLAVLITAMTNRLFAVSREEMLQLLDQPFVTFADVQNTSLDEGKTSDCGLGSCALVVANRPGDPWKDTVVAGWKGKGRWSLMISKEEKESLRTLLEDP